MSLSSDSEKEVPDSMGRREFLGRVLRTTGGIGATSILAKAGMFSALASLIGCTGAFEVVRLNNAPPYEHYHCNDDIRRIRGAYLNGADLRGNTSNLWEIVSRGKIKWRAKKLAEILRDLEVDFFDASEMDYKDTVMRGRLNQPELVARYMGDPYNYVLFDQYMKSPLWTTGNAVISRFPMKAIYRHIFDKKWSFLGRWRHVYKDFIHVGLKVGKRKLDNIVNHFDDGLMSVKMKEANDLLKYVTTLKRDNSDSYIVSAGDYNAGHKSKPIRRLLSNGILVPPPMNFGMETYPSHEPKHDIDHAFFTKNIKVHSYETFYYPWSDHRGIVFDVEFL